MGFQIIECDFNNSIHRQKVIELTAAYMLDPMGGEEIMPEINRGNLVEGLAKNPSRFIVFAMIDEKYIGIATCFINSISLTDDVNISE